MPKKENTKDIGLHPREASSVKYVGGTRYTGLFYDGKEIVIGKKPGRPPRRISNPENGWWSQEKKIEACTLYAALGSVSDVSKIAEIPENFIRAWMTEKWWIDITQQIVNEQDSALTIKFTNIINNALDKLSEIIDKGNRIYIPKKDIFVDVPLTANDLTKVAAAFTDKRQLIQGKPTSRTESITSDDRLKKLAEQFEKFTKAKEVIQEVEEIDEIT